MSESTPRFRIGFHHASWWPLSNGYQSGVGAIELSPGEKIIVQKFLLRHSGEGIFYHYTTVEGLFGIIEQNAVWASHVRYMNDASEVVHGRELALRVLRTSAAKLRFGSFTEVLRKAIDILDGQEIPDYFVASFSRRDDDLTQWRAYGQDRGVCIGFDLAAPDSFYHFWSPDTAITVYRTSLKIGFIVFWIRKFFEEFRSDLTFHGGTLPDWMWDRYASSLAQKLQFEFVRFKHDSFESEREVRFIIFGEEEDKLRPRRYRVRGNLIIPYHYTSDRIWRKDGAIIEPPTIRLSSVTIGPMSGQEICARSMREFLNDRGHGGVALKLSRLPYRSH